MEKEDNQRLHDIEGIISVLQTPFNSKKQIDWNCYGKLIRNSMQSGVNGFLVPAVASEVACLTLVERQDIIHFVADSTKEKLPFIVGASGQTVDQCRYFAKLAHEVSADAYLVAVTPELYANPSQIVSFFQAIVPVTNLPIIIQDLQFNGPGLSLDITKQLHKTLPTLAGMKIETVPAGPKYTTIRHLFGREFLIAGGWAVPQMLEALDRDIDAMIPESSMIKVYSAIIKLYRSGDRQKAKDLFWKLLPILAFANQNLETSIAFFKRLLVAKGIFNTEVMRYNYVFDSFQKRIADDLIAHYLEIESSIQDLSTS